MTDIKTIMSWLEGLAEPDWRMFHSDSEVQNIAKETLALLKEQERVVRCKDCVHRGKSEKCVLAAISKEKDFPLFMLDNRGEWYCADREVEIP